MSLKQGIEERIKGLALEGCELIFIKEEMLYERIKKMKFPGIAREVRIIRVNDLSDLKAMSLRDMKKIGWIRKEKLSVEDLVEMLHEKGYDVIFEDDKK